MTRNLSYFEGYAIIRIGPGYRLEFFWNPYAGRIYVDGGRGKFYRIYDQAYAVVQ